MPNVKVKVGKDVFDLVRKYDIDVNKAILDLLKKKRDKFS